MRDILTDIKDKLERGEYQNEEHVRLSLVCALLYQLGWDLWDPAEVNTEFPPVPAEDKSRVDIALFADRISPSVFIEVKAVGKIAPNLTAVETQVRDYNRNNTALFSVITDGRSWRLYYSQTAGEFHHKCFKQCDLLKDDLEDVEQTFSLFFRKENIRDGSAEEHAKKYLQLTKKQKAVQDCLPQARRSVNAAPYPSLPQALVEEVAKKGYSLSETEAGGILAQMPEPSTPRAIPEVHPRTRERQDQPRLGRKGNKNVRDYLIPVIRLMRQGKSHNEAFKAIAEELGIASPTVSSQCTRTLGINTAQFVDCVKSGHIVQFIKKRYPNEAYLIDEELGE